MTTSSSRRRSSSRRTLRSITVLLIPKVARELDRTRRRGQLSDTDIVNRAISLYNFVEKELDSGAQLLLYRPRSGLAEKVQLK